MEKVKKKSRLRRVLRLILWIFLVQFILINISAVLYAYKFTHLYPAEEAVSQTPPHNVFAKTWRLFAGDRFYKQAITVKPDSAYETIYLKTSSGISIEAWYCHHNSSDSSAAKGTVLLFHGLTGNKNTVTEQAKQFRNQGYNVMMADTRSHGNSDGNTTTIGYRESEEVKLVYDYIRSRGEQRIFLWGFSMGSVQIMKAIADYRLQLSGVILEMPFLSLQSHVKNRVSAQGFPKQPFGFFITFWIGTQRGFNGFAFNTLTYAKKINCPVLLQCGSSDQLVTRKEVEQIYQSISSGNKKLVVYDDTNHESLLQKDPVTWKKEISAFLEEGLVRVK